MARAAKSWAFCSTSFANSNTSCWRVELLTLRGRLRRSFGLRINLSYPLPDPGPPRYSGGRFELLQSSNLVRFSNLGAFHYICVAYHGHLWASSIAESTSNCPERAISQRTCQKFLFLRSSLTATSLLEGLTTSKVLPSLAGRRLLLRNIPDRISLIASFSGVILLEEEEVRKEQTPTVRLQMQQGHGQNHNFIRRLKATQGKRNYAFWFVYFEEIEELN